MKIYGHRGYSAKYPENTMLAFTKAVEYHADGIETDVHKTKDGVLVLCHDETIDRTSNGSGAIKDLTYEELLQYNFKYNKDVDEFVPIPRLDELLSLAKKTGIYLNIEIKTDNYQYKNIEKMTYDMVKAYGMLDHVMFSSFNFDSLVKLRKVNPRVKVGYLFEEEKGKTLEETYQNKLKLALTHGIKQIHPRFDFLDEKKLYELRKKQIEVNAWTINQKEDIQFFHEHRLNGCITNFVELGMEIKKGETR